MGLSETSSKGVSSLQKKRIVSIGFLFSLGHGLIVIGVSLVIGSGLLQSHTPLWLDFIGKRTSIVFLFVFGLLNLWNIFQTKGQLALPVGIQSLLARQLNARVRSPFAIMLVGALFAFSFDTFSQIALFSFFIIFILLLSNAAIGFWEEYQAGQCYCSAKG